MKRDEQISSMLVNAYSNQEIADALGLKRRTIKFLMTKMFKQYEIRGGAKRVKLATLLYRKELCSPPTMDSRTTRRRRPEQSGNQRTNRNLLSFGEEPNQEDLRDFGDSTLGWSWPCGM